MAPTTKNALKIAQKRVHKVATKGAAPSKAKSAPKSAPTSHKTVPKAAAAIHPSHKLTSKPAAKAKPIVAVGKTQPIAKSKVQVAKTVKSVTPKSAPAKAAAVTKPIDKKLAVKLKNGASKVAVAVKTLIDKAPVAKAPVTKAQVSKVPVAPVAKAPAAKAPVLAKAPVAAKPPMAHPPVAKAVVPPGAPVMPKAAAHPVLPQALAPRVALAGQRAMPAAVGKPGQPKLTAPVSAVRPGLAAAAPANPAALAAAVAAAKKPVNSRHGFKTNEFVVYPAHGVGRIVGIEEQEIAGISLELFVIQFEKDKMTLRVPTSKLQSVGMRKLAEAGIVNRAMETLKGKARIKRTMWSRRAQEYEAKINSGDLIAIAEVVRDLYRSEAQPEQSYSERQLYEAALDRMAREIAAVDKIDERSAMQRITEVLSKSARGRRAAEEEAAAASAGAEVKAA